MTGVIVIGGGIVGVCAALRLQQGGCETVLMECKEVGGGASFGNAGILSESSIIVINNPATLAGWRGWWRNQSAAVRFHPPSVLRRPGWFLRFLAHARDSHMQRAAAALRPLLLLSLAEHQRLINAAGAGELLRQTGWLRLYRSRRGFAEFEHTRPLFDKAGVSYTVLDAGALRALAPALKDIFYAAVHTADTCSISEPAALTAHYLALFKRAGGSVLQARAVRLLPPAAPTAAWRVATADGSYATAKQVVVAAGAWSAEVAATAGYRFPLFWERGYHRHFHPPAADRALALPILDVEGGYALAHMTGGYRLTSGVQFARRDAPPDWTQLDTAEQNARQALELGAATAAAAWLGCRPTLPDSLPVIGAAPRHARLWFNFGHQHIGLTAATGSAIVLESQMSGKPPPIDDAAFSPARFFQ